MTSLRNRRSLLFSVVLVAAAIIIVLVLLVPRFLQAHTIHTIGGTAPNNNQWIDSSWIHPIIPFWEQHKIQPAMSGLLAAAAFSERYFIRLLILLTQLPCNFSLETAIM